MADQNKIERNAMVAYLAFGRIEWDDLPEEHRVAWRMVADVLLMANEHTFFSMPRMFVLERHVDETGISGTGVVAEGIEFSDGVVALRWLVPQGNPGSGNPTSVVFHDNGIESVKKIHGHNGATEIRWLV